MDSSVETIPVPQFVDYLNKHVDVYKNCDVICISHVKNLESAFLHEYLHVVIRDAAGARWRRLLAERQNDKDQVIIGLWPWTPLGTLTKGLGGGAVAADDGLLPLIMRNITIKSGLPLSKVASVLVEVNKQAPKYNVVTKNCFWYAASVFKLLEGYGQVYNWCWMDMIACPFIPDSTAVRVNLLLFRDHAQLD